MHAYDTEVLDLYYLNHKKDFLHLKKYNLLMDLNLLI